MKITYPTDPTFYTIKILKTDTSKLSFGSWFLL